MNTQFPQQGPILAGQTTPTDKESLLGKLFRIGFASIFLVNGVTALLRPEDYRDLLNSFPVAQTVGHIDLMILAASLNDLLLSSLILSGKAKKFVWAWAGLWLAMVSTIKLTSLF